MSWSDFKPLSAGAAALAIACLAAPAETRTLVVRSAGPSAASYPPGRTIEDSARIVLQPNDQIVLLDGRGTRRLTGPGAFSPLAVTSAGIDSRSTFAALIAQRADRRARVGAVRSMTAAPRPSIWVIDIDKSSTVCVGDPASLALWRAGGPKPASVTVTGEVGARNTTETAVWAAGEATAPWPASLPAAPGMTYSISWPGAAQPTKVRFAAIDRAPQGLEELASMLIRNGCDAQLDLLIETVAIPEGSSPSGG